MFDAAESGAGQRVAAAGFVGVADEFAGRVAVLDPAAMVGADAARLVKVLDRVIRVASAKRLDALARVEHTGSYRNDGDRSAAEWVARTTGTSPGQAHRDLGLAGRLAKAPETRERLGRGEVSVEQADVVARAAEADPASENRLLEAATVRSLGELKEAAARVINAATDAEERRKRIHANRHMRTWTDNEGAFRLSGSLTPEAGAVFLTALEPFQKAAFDAARKDGRHEDHDRYAADALVALARHSNDPTPTRNKSEVETTPNELLFPDAPGKPRRGRTDMTLLVDLAALQHGKLEPGDTCEIPGVGPVALSVARDLFGDALLTVIIRDGIDIRTVVHPSRSPNADQRRALLVRDRTCSIAGCGRRGRLETDHNTPWSQGGKTTITNLCRLCTKHHRQKTAGWTLTGPPGRMTLTPPGHQTAPGDERQPRAG